MGYPTTISPVLKASLPDDITRNSDRIRWETILDWYAAYAGSSQLIHLSVSIDGSIEDLNIHNVEIVIKPDLSDISLHVITTCQLAPHFRSVLEPQYHILEDHTLVSEVYVDSIDVISSHHHLA